MSELFPVIASQLGPTYTAIVLHGDAIQAALTSEENSFLSTMQHGSAMLQEQFADTNARSLPLASPGMLAPSFVFQLYHTHGLPLDFTRMIADEHGLSFDEASVAELMEQHKVVSRSGRISSSRAIESHEREARATLLSQLADARHARGTVFSGYERLEEPNASILAAVPFTEQQASDAGATHALVSISPCPFYARGGGQRGDAGWLELADADATAPVRVRVLDSWPETTGDLTFTVLKLHARADELALLCRGADGAQSVRAIVDRDVRDACSRNHTATHLLHAALRHVLATTRHATVMQAGSDVNERRLRFDFTLAPLAGSPAGPQCFAALSPAELRLTEAWVQRIIEQDLPVTTAIKDQATAIAEGACCLAGETYADQVRVVTVAGEATATAAAAASSMELCGGTHVRSTAALRPFLILKEARRHAFVVAFRSSLTMAAVTQASVGSGTRRLEALTSDAAESYLRSRSDTLAAIERLVGPLDPTTSADAQTTPAVVERIKTLTESLRGTEQRLAAMSVSLAVASTPKPRLLHLTEQGADHPTALLLYTVPLLHDKSSPSGTSGSAGAKELIEIAERLVRADGDRSASRIFVRGKEILCVAPSGEAEKAAPANKLLASVFKLVNGRGGGNSARAVGVLASDADLDALLARLQ